MVIFKSQRPWLDIPQDVAIWDWLFDSADSPLRRFGEGELAGYFDHATKERLSWAQVKEASTHISTALAAEHGFRAGDTLTLFSGNTVWYPVAMFSAMRLGGVVCGASPAFNVEEMATALTTAKARFLAAAPESMDVAVAAAAQAGIPRERIFLIAGELDGYTSIKDLMELGKSMGEEKQAPSFKIPAGKTNFDVCALLCFSSGTTGLPKAVMIAHQNIIAQAMQARQNTPASQKKTIAVLPFYHISGLVHILHLPVLLNAEVIMLPKFDIRSMLEVVAEHRIEELLVVPPLLIRLVHDAVVDEFDLSCVRRFSSGAAPVSDEIMRLLAKKFPNTGFKNGYGMTETTSCVTGFPEDLLDYKYAYSVGKLLANTEFKIVKEGGGEAGVGEAGEIFAKGPQCVMGYLDNEEATRETFRIDGEWLRTGDLGSVDEEGIVTIHDRIKEMIKVKGIGVAPAELEDLLLGHAAVRDCAVIGVPDDYSGEIPKAFVVPQAGSSPGDALAEDLQAYVQERKVRYKWVKRFEFVDEIPKSPSGKILRKVLRSREIEAAKKAGGSAEQQEKEEKVNGDASKTNGHANGQPNGADGHVNGHANGH